jgi:hypothetical protein
MVQGAVGAGAMAAITVPALIAGTALTAGALPLIVGGLAALGGGFGFWKGGKNEAEKTALTTTGMLSFGQSSAAEFGEGGRSSLESKLEDFNETFTDDEKFKAWARAQGFEEDEAQNQRGGIAATVAQAYQDNLVSLDAAVGTIAERTGMHASDIEKAADQMGMALRNTKSSMQDFYMSLYEEFETTTQAAGVVMYEDEINKSFNDVVLGSRFHKGALEDEALGQSQAANNAMYQELLTTGDISNDTAAAGIDAAIAQGQALGHSGYDLVQFVERFGVGFQNDMNAQGLGEGAKKFTNEIASFSDRTFDDFVNSDSVKQLQIMNEMWDRPELDRAGLKQMWKEGDIEQELAKANLEVWELARQAKKDETTAVVAATTAAANLAAALELAAQASTRPGGPPMIRKLQDAGDNPPVYFPRVATNRFDKAQVMSPEEALQNALTSDSYVSGGDRTGGKKSGG